MPQGRLQSLQAQQEAAARPMRSASSQHPREGRCYTTHQGSISGTSHLVQRPLEFPVTEIVGNPDTERSCSRQHRPGPRARLGKLKAPISSDPLTSHPHWSQAMRQMTDGRPSPHGTSNAGNAESCGLPGPVCPTTPAKPGGQVGSRPQCPTLYLQTQSGPRAEPPRI